MSKLLSCRAGFWRLIKSGLSLFLILFSFKYLVVMIWCELNKISFSLDRVPNVLAGIVVLLNQIPNVLVNIVVLAIFLCLLGYLNQSKWFQNLKDNFLAHLPFIGPGVKVYNQLEEIKNNAPEVSVEIADGIYILGWISREWKNEKGVDMCEVQVPAHINLAGLPLTVRKDKLFFTGRKAGKAIIFTLSGGIAGDPPMKL
mgnify:CR=1 FL=1